MDVALSPKRKAPRIKPAAAIAIASAILLVAGFYLIVNTRGGTIVDRSTVVTDTVRRGTLVRTVSGAGTLVAENVRVVSAVESGVVEVAQVRPGSRVTAGDVVLRLSNPTITMAVVDASSALQVAQAQLSSAREQAKAAALSQQSTLANARAQMQEDVTGAAALTSLHRNGLVADATYRIAQIRAEQSRRQVAIGQAEVSVDAADEQAKIAAAQAQVDEASAQLGAHQADLDRLMVRAGAAGVVQTVDVEPGARVDAGTEIAKIADPRKLKAVLQVPEAEVQDVTLGLPVRVDTPQGTFDGSVSHIAPSAQNGSFAVDVTFARGLPAGCRPDVTVEGSIQIDRIPDALSLARPAGTQDDGFTSLYVVDPSGRNAAPVRVRLGMGSTERIQVLSGLSEGQTVIVSDTSAFAGQSAIRLR